MLRIIIIVLLLLSGAAYAAGAEQYSCPMHPQIVADHSGSCPICGMDLVLKESHAMPEEGAPIIGITADTMQKMGVRTAKVSNETFGKVLRATGSILANERLRRDVASQMEGRVENLKFSAIGDRVKQGELFYTLASTELQRMQSDYLIAVRGGTKAGMEGAARRLRLMGVDDSVITSLREKGDAFEHVPFYIPADGIITRLEIRNGHYLQSGDEIGHIQGLASVWVDAALPEADLLRVQEGDTATVRVNGAPLPYNAVVEHIHPTIQEDTRTGFARLVVENPEETLRPGGYASVEFHLNPAARLSVPSEAVLHATSGTHVILALGDGKFQARQVHTGITADGKTEILHGLKLGEEVVTSGQFLFDSETNLREGFKKLGGEHVH